MADGRLSERLPDFPWDLLAPAKRAAAEHPGGLVDLSMGTPVDPVPPVVREALAAASDSPGYPPTAGTAELRAAIAEWVVRACIAPGSARSDPRSEATRPVRAGLSGRPASAPGDGLGVLPTIGSKELVAWLPTLLGIGPGDTVVIPTVCYPTYEVGVRLAGATPVRTDSLTSLGPARVKLVWVNSPSNPTGQVLPAGHLRKVVDWARERGAVVASDECYLTLGWEDEPVSVLSPEVSGGRFDGLLALHSLSKRSNLAGYRAGFVAGDPGVVSELLAVRKHGGLIVPAPVQAAMVAALGDEEHAVAQRTAYAARRDVLRAALVKAGFEIEHSGAGLYLWATRGDDSWSTVDWFAERGILVAPGAFYGPAGERHVRVALTATDERVAAAAERLES